LAAPELRADSAPELTQRPPRERESSRGLRFTSMPACSSWKHVSAAPRVCATGGARAKAEEAVPVDGTDDEFPVNDTVRFETLQGVAEAEDAMDVSAGSSTGRIATIVTTRRSRGEVFDQVTRVLMRAGKRARLATRTARGIVRPAQPSSQPRSGFARLRARLP
jgi:hypothetical protein